MMRRWGTLHASAYASIEPTDMGYNGPAPHCGYCYKTIHEPWCIYQRPKATAHYGFSSEVHTIRSLIAYDSIDPLAWDGSGPNGAWPDPWPAASPKELAEEQAEREWLKQVNARIPWPSAHTLFVIGGVIAWIVLLWRVL